jgi:hypothetical protein
VLGKLDHRVGLGGREQRLDHVNRFVDATRVPDTPRGMARTRARRTPGRPLLATAQPVTWRRQPRQRRAAANSTTTPSSSEHGAPPSATQPQATPRMKRTWPAGHVHNPPGSRRIHKEGGRDQACTNMPICRHFLLVDVGPLGWLKIVVSPVRVRVSPSGEVPARSPILAGRASASCERERARPIGYVLFTSFSRRTAKR